MINNYSPNMLKIFEKCPYEFYLKYIQKLNLPQQAKIFEKGKKIHALASYFLKGFEIEKMEKVLTSDEKKIWESLKSNKYFKLEVLETEYNLSCKVGDFWVGGRLDALVRTLPTCPSPLKGKENSANSDFKMNCYYILDYKTGQIPQNAEYDFQTIIYLLAADKFLQKKGGYKKLKFIYLGLKNNTEKEIVLTEELKKAYEEKILAICKEIQIAIKTNKFSKHCKTCDNCEYQKLCK